jgi:hypothetical protein
MSRKINVDLTQVDIEAGKHWLSKPTTEELKQQRDEIRRKNREAYLAKQPWSKKRKGDGNR